MGGAWSGPFAGVSLRDRCGGTWWCMRAVCAGRMPRRARVFLSWSCVWVFAFSSRFDLFVSHCRFSRSSAIRPPPLRLLHADCTRVNQQTAKTNEDQLARPDSPRVTLAASRNTRGRAPCHPHLLRHCLALVVFQLYAAREPPTAYPLPHLAAACCDADRSELPR